MGLSLALRNLNKDEASMLNFAQYYAAHGRWTWLPIRGALRHDPPSESLPAHIKNLAETGLIKVHGDRQILFQNPYAKSDRFELQGDTHTRAANTRCDLLHVNLFHITFYEEGKYWQASLVQVRDTV